jgi:hypothetical protein
MDRAGVGEAQRNLRVPLAIEMRHARVELETHTHQ